MKRSAAQRRAGRVTSVLAALALLVFTVVAVSKAYELDRELWLIRATGYAALTGLFLALSMTPAGRLAGRLAPGRVRRTDLIAWRRSFGISSAGLALIHAGLALATYLRGSWAAIPENPYLRAGLAALAVLTALLLTSFPELVAFLRVKMWNELHRLAYVAVIFVLQHLLLSPFAPRRLTLLLFGGLLLIQLLRFLPRGRANAPSPSA